MTDGGAADGPGRDGTAAVSDLTIPGRLVAPEPGWTSSADVIVVGSGIAGLTTALRLRQRVDRVLLDSPPPRRVPSKLALVRFPP